MKKLTAISLIGFSSVALSEPDWEALSSTLDDQLILLSKDYVDLCAGSHSREACDQIVSSVDDMNALLETQALPKIIEIKMGALNQIAEKAKEAADDLNKV